MTGAEPNRRDVVLIDDYNDMSILQSSSQSTSHQGPTANLSASKVTFSLPSYGGWSAVSRPPPTPRLSPFESSGSIDLTGDDDKLVMPSAPESGEVDCVLIESDGDEDEANPPLNSNQRFSPDVPTAVQHEPEDLPLPDSEDGMKAEDEATELATSEEESFLVVGSSDDESLSWEDLSGSVSVKHETPEPSSSKARRNSSKTKRKSSGAKGRHKSSVMPLRNQDVEPAMRKLDSYDHLGINLRERATVELEDEDFLQIVIVLQDIETGAVFLRGHRFRRTRLMNRLFARKRNEVCWIQELDNDDARLAEIQSMDTVSVTEVIKRRRLRCTNQAYPALSFREDKSIVLPHDKDPNKEDFYYAIEKNAVLVCRMKFVRFYADAKARDKNNPCEKAAISIRQDECDPGHDNDLTDLQLRAMWRGNTEKGGAQVGWLPGEKEFLRQEAISHHGRQCNNSLLVDGRKYEPGDVMTRGAVGDMLIRDEGSEAMYQKLSGVNDPSFTRSSLNIETGKEIMDTKVYNARLDMRMMHAIRGVQYEGGAFYMNDENRRPQTRPATPQGAPEIVEIDAHLRKTYGNVIYQQRIEGKITSTISPRSADSQHKRTASEAFPFPLMSSKRSTAGFGNTTKEDRTMDLTSPTPRSPAPPSLLATSGGVERESPVDRKLYETQHRPRFQWGATLNNHGLHQREFASPITRQGTPTSAVTKNPAITKLPMKPQQRRYTFGDCFCGAGGMSRGAVMAGLRVRWGFDFNDIACYSYALNFLGARVYLEQAHIFSTSQANQQVDICHMSPPCQFFSPAHTVAGPNDEMNTASFFAVGELLNKTRSRIVILEQTAGLVNRHGMYFHTCVREFTERGFNIRWKIINCADFGLPQRRTRLFMIASW